MAVTERITTPFTAESTAAQVLAGVDLGGRRSVVTGASSGLGIETARALAGAGSEVTLAVRDLGAGRRAAADIAASTGNNAVHVAALDLADLGSVAAFAAAWVGPLHILVNNAGIMATPQMNTPQGWELQFATNHVGHFALASGLRPALAAAGGARVAVVSSAAHLRAAVDFDDIHFERRRYQPWVAYGQSKTANVLFAVEATRRWAEDGIAVNALMPGAISTNLQRHVDTAEMERLRARSGAPEQQWKSVEQGAATSVLVAASPLLDGVGGRYFEDCNEALAHTPGSPGGVAAYALDPGAAKQLWDVTARMLA
ncbi:oxidoreductase [Frankia sp. R43]|uniref:SDR family NAD(P)-dependent oxidoreductase n=1 Tax=Frankia sp. R43 TaxID=269536 RepID=UPI0006CA172D|nr:SDR family NAD(P)-dependent oxidoreductase [Frankia sp. R43]KPM54446.1 oxidoreductase [Frankia sp. R43]